MHKRLVHSCCTCKRLSCLDRLLSIWHVLPFGRLCLLMESIVRSVTACAQDFSKFRKPMLKRNVMMINHYSSLCCGLGWKSKLNCSANRVLFFRNKLRSYTFCYYVSSKENNSFHTEVASCPCYFQSGFGSNWKLLRHCWLIVCRNWWQYCYHPPFVHIHLL